MVLEEILLGDSLYTAGDAYPLCEREMTKLKLFSTIVAFFFLSTWALAVDKYVMQAKELTANHFDATLPRKPIGNWLRENIPPGYEIIWGDYITDCGESTGTSVDKDRNMPLCAEVEIKDKLRITGYLALFVGTRDGGFFKEGFGIYYGYLKHNGNQYTIKQLGDLQSVK